MNKRIYFKWTHYVFLILFAVESFCFAQDKELEVATEKKEIVKQTQACLSLNAGYLFFRDGSIDSVNHQAIPVTASGTVYVNKNHGLGAFVSSETYLSTNYDALAPAVGASRDLFYSFSLGTYYSFRLPISEVIWAHYDIGLGLQTFVYKIGGS